VKADSGNRDVSRDRVVRLTNHADFLYASEEPSRQQVQTYHLQPLVHLGHLLEVMLACGDIPLLVPGAKINHVARPKRLAMLFKVHLICVKHSIKPR
jgi:hypothetical protein